jgi:hypothetical protein
MTTVFSTSNGIDSTTEIPDINKDPISTVAPSAAMILKRVLKKEGAEVPVAAFQSSI